MSNRDLDSRDDTHLQDETVVALISRYTILAEYSGRGNDHLHIIAFIEPVDTDQEVISHATTTVEGGGTDQERVAGDSEANTPVEAGDTDDEDQIPELLDVSDDEQEIPGTMEQEVIEYVRGYIVRGQGTRST